MSRYPDGCVSNSMLNVLARSPKEFYQRFIEETWTEDEPGKALTLGSALHCKVLEPELFGDRYILAPRVDGRTKEGKAARAALAEAAGDRTIIDADTHELVAAMARSIEQHDDASELLAPGHGGIVERPILWGWNDISCAGTPDLVCLDRRLIVDVKTTQDASPEAFAGSVAKYGYHRQAAMYCRGVEEVYGETCRFIFIAVCSNPPHDVGVYELSMAAIDQGAAEVVSLLEEYKRRKETHDWKSAWSRGVVELSLPRWYRPSFYGDEVMR
jgi:exodeoxyribonuclease VIII